MLALFRDEVIGRTTCNSRMINCFCKALFERVIGNNNINYGLTFVNASVMRSLIVAEV